MSESSLGLALISVVLILFACQFGDSSAVSVKYRQNEATGDTVTTSSSNPELSFITVDHPNNPTSESSTSTSNATSHVYFHQQFPADNESETKQIVPNAEVAEGEEGGEQEDENNTEQTTIQSTIPTPAIEAPSGFGSGALSASLVADLNNRNLTSSETRQHYLGYEPNNWNSYSTDIDHHDGISKRQAQYPLDVVNGGGGGAAQEDERTANDDDYDGDSSDEGSNDDGNGDYDSDDEPSEDQAAQGGGNSGGGGDNGGNNDDGTDGEFGMSDQDDADFDQENSASFSIPKFDSVSNDDNSVKTTPNTNNDNDNNNNNKNSKNGCKTVYKQIETIPFSGDKTVTQLHRSRRSILDSGMDDFEEIFADDELGENENPKKSSSTSSSYMISSECHYDGNGKLEKNQKKNTGAGGGDDGEKDSKTANNNDNSDNQISSKPKSKSMIQSQIENPSTIAVPTTIVPTIPTGFQAGAAESSFMATDDDMESSDSIRGAMHDTLNLPRRRNLMASYVSNNEMGHSMDFQMPFSSNAKFHRFPYPHYHIYYDQSPTASLAPDEREQAVMKRQQRLHARRQHNSPIYNNEDDIGSLEQPVEYIDNVPDQQNNDNGEEAATVGEGLDENAVEESDDELDLGVRKSRQRRSRPNLYAYEDNYSQGPKSTDRPKNIEYGYYREIVDQPSIVKTSTSKPKSLSSSLLSGGGSSERSQGAIADKYRINSGDAIDTVAPVKRSRRRMKKSTSNTATNEPLNDDGDSGYDDGGDGEQGDGSNDDGNADYSQSYGGGSYDEYDSDKDRGNEGGDESGGSSNGDENGQQEDDREDDY